MAVYTTAAKVAGHFPSFKMTATSQPTQAQVEGYIANYAAIIEAVCIGRGYDLSNLTDRQIALLNVINEAGAAVDLGTALYGKITTSDSKEAKSQYDSYDRNLKMLEKGSFDKLFLEKASVAETTTSFGASLPDKPMTTRDEEF